MSRRREVVSTARGGDRGPGRAGASRAARRVARGPRDGVVHHRAAGHRGPESLTPEQRLAELGHILATGYLRLQGARRAPVSAAVGQDGGQDRDVADPAEAPTRGHGARQEGGAGLGVRGGVEAGHRDSPNPANELADPDPAEPACDPVDSRESGKEVA